MKKNGTLFKVTSFTYIQGIKSVWFWVILVLGLATMVLGMNYDKIIASFNETDTSFVCVVDETAEQLYAPVYKNADTERCKYEVIDPEKEASVRKEIENNTSAYDACLIFSADGRHAELIYGDKADESALRIDVLPAADSLLRLHIAETMGIGAAQASALLYDTYVSRTYIAGDAAAGGYLLVIIFIIVLYLLILLYGAILSNSVVEEKGNRIMETMVCYSDPMSLMFGKILGFLLLALTHIAVWGLASVALYHQFIDGTEASALVQEIFTAKTAFLFAGCLVLGFLFYAIAYVASASFADNAQDSTTLVMPMTLVLLLAFVLAMMSMRHSTQTLNLVLSFCPFVAPILLFGNAVYHHMSMGLVLLSFGVQLVEIFVLAKVGSALYRKGIFRYGGLKWSVFGKRKKAAKPDEPET